MLAASCEKTAPACMSSIREGRIFAMCKSSSSAKSDGELLRGGQAYLASPRLVIGCYIWQLLALSRIAVGGGMVSHTALGTIDVPSASFCIPEEYIFDTYTDGRW